MNPSGAACLPRRAVMGCFVRRQQRHPPVITDAEPSLEDEQRRRKRIYTAIMGLHIIGLAVAGVLFALVHVWWWAFVVLAIAALLRLVAALVTNAGSAKRTRRRFAAREHRHSPKSGSA